uniref:Uncharacterized protein MANES_12G057900 n=1 Tax=Rhizophora mucronata TaxID=61149 RepID=A0A2P2JTJ5_RHIMU
MLSARVPIGCDRARATSEVQRRSVHVAMVRLFLSKPNWEKDAGGEDTGFGNRWILLLKEFESVFWSLMAAGGRSEARLWLCNTISGISSIAPNRKRDLFESLLRAKPRNRALASQLLQMIFERRPNKAGAIIAKRSSVLEKFFEGHPNRILQWFSCFAAAGSAHGGVDRKKGAKALSQFAFVNRDICWEELEWKGKHGQSPAMVATKPHYFMDLDVQRTVENFIDNVPEFWSSSEFAESLKDGDILSIDTKFFEEFFVGLMYKEDSRDVWEVIGEFLMEESYSFLCHHFLIALDEKELFCVLGMLRKYVNPKLELDDFDKSSVWLELVLSRSSGFESIDQFLLLSAVISQGRQLLRLVHDEASQEETAKIKDIMLQICSISNSLDSLFPMLNECLKMKTSEAIKFLGLQSWVVHYTLSEECRTPESWESLFSVNKISFRKSDRYSLLDHEGWSEGNDSELEYRVSTKRKHRKTKKSRKKKRSNFDNDDGYDLQEFETSNNRLDLQPGDGSWLLSTDGFTSTWTNVSSVLVIQELFDSFYHCTCTIL